MRPFSFLVAALAACSTTATEPPFCGDDRLDPGEQCDDGNELPGDGCSPACTTEQERAVRWQVVDVAGEAGACPSGSTIEVTADAGSTSVETAADCALGEATVRYDRLARTIGLALLGADGTPRAGSPSQPIPDDETPMMFTIIRDGALLAVDWAVIDRATGATLACSDLGAFDVTLTAMPLPPSAGPALELRAPCEPQTSPGINGTVEMGALPAGQYSLALAIGDIALTDVGADHDGAHGISAANVTESLLFLGDR